MPKHKNKSLQLKMLWYVVFLLSLSLNVHACNEEIVFLFPPVPSIAVASDDAAIGTAIPRSQQELLSTSSFLSPKAKHMEKCLTWICGFDRNDAVKQTKLTMKQRFS